MWFRIELHKDNSIASCVQVSDSRNDGRAVHYIEAANKEDAIKTLLARYDLNNERRRQAVKNRTERLRAEGLCRKCGRVPCGGDGMFYCAGCLDKKKDYQQAVKNGQPVVPNCFTTDAKLSSQLKRQKQDIKRASQRANGNYIIVRVAYARCLHSFDTMTPTPFRSWLCEELIKAQAKEAASAARRSEAFRKKCKSQIRRNVLAVA